MRLWQLLKLDEFWQPLRGSRARARIWHQVLMVLVAYRLIFHQREEHIEAHMLCARQPLPGFPYLLHPCSRSSPTACMSRWITNSTSEPPDSPLQQALDKLAAIQMLDVRFPTTDGRELHDFTRYTEPEADQQLILAN